VTEADLVLENGRIVDGTGSPWYRGDVAITDGEIVALGDVSASADRVVDVTDAVVAPGFIDIHTHSDFTLPVDREAHSKVRQGVTLEVVGNCGMSAAPRVGAAADEVDDDFAFFGVTEAVDTSQWESMGEFLDFLDDGGLSINVASLVGHKNARVAVVGYDDREPTAAELDEMRELVDRALSAGAVGLSTGLIYTPGAYADTDELVALAEVAADHGGIYATHMRSEGDDLIAAVEEALTVGRQAAIPVQISHHKAVGPDNWGKIRYTLRRLELAREREGIDVQCDQYPYAASSTYLSARVPPWAHEGGTEALLDRLRDPETVERIESELADYAGSWDNILLTEVHTAELSHVEGKTLRELADRDGEDRSPVSIVTDVLLADDAQTRHVHFGMDRADVETVMQHDLTMIGSDGNSLRRDGPLGEGMPHPRSYGTFPRVLGRYVREESVLTLETAVHKMTGLPAARLGLEDRGVLKPGMRADVTVFSPDTVGQAGSFTDPAQYADGVRHVLVDGTFVVEHREHTGARPGRTLR
jgi:N-acyl-D-amino-acid deacylase